MKIKKKVKKLITSIFADKSWKCNICGKEIFTDSDLNLCDTCVHTIIPNAYDFCPKCNKPYTKDNKCIACANNYFLFEKAYAPYIYEDGIKFLLSKLKFKNRAYIADNFSDALKNFIKLKHIHFDLVTSIPMSDDSFKARGYNQSYLIARHLAEGFYFRDFLFKKKTLPQHNLKYKEREANIKNAFSFNDKYTDIIKNKIILLVDDIFTTGLTLNEATRVLLDNGAKKVICLCVAHTKL